MGTYEGGDDGSKVVLTVIYGSESWVLNVEKGGKVQEIIRNKDMKEGCGNEESFEKSEPSHP